MQTMSGYGLLNMGRHVDERGRTKQMQRVRKRGVKEVFFRESKTRC